MEQSTNKQNISRRRFLQTCGTILAGGSIAGLSGFLLHKNLTAPEKNRGVVSLSAEVESFPSPYKQVAAFKVPAPIEAFELNGNQLIAAVANQILIYDEAGNLTNSFAVGSNLRDIATDGSSIYLLFPTRIEVYSLSGEQQRSWEACSDNSDYCSMTLTPSAIFVTDAANKNICKYTTGGNFVRFIQSPDGFIIPSYTFGIAYVNGIIYCSNSGRHRIEKYTPKGEYIGAFGKAGNAAGMFCGCCNPVHLAHTATGELITSEKGNPRISCYGADGEFRSLLLDSKALGGGNAAYDVKVYKDKLFVAGKDMVSIYQYDKSLAAKTACAGCKVNCPLRKGISI